MESGRKSNTAFTINLPKTPSHSGVKQDDTLLLQNTPRVKRDQEQTMREQEPIVREEAPIVRGQARLQPFIDAPPRAQIQAFNFITLGRFQIDSTITRRICKVLLLLTIKMLSMLTATVFWICTPVCLKTLLNWKAPGNILYELPRYLSGSPSATSIWRHIFPGTEYANSHHLRLAIHGSSHPHSPIIYSTSITLILENPVVWLSVLLFMFTSQHLLCFAHDSISKVNPAIRSAD
jgi:hypothetical protein